MNITQTYLLIFIAVFLTADIAYSEELTLNQKLILACHRVDVQGVVDALRQGATVNARFGKGDEKLFEDKWTLGWPIQANAFTPLLALADSSKFPDPPRKVKNTGNDISWSVRRDLQS